MFGRKTKARNKLFPTHIDYVFCFFDSFSKHDKFELFAGFAQRIRLSINKIKVGCFY